MKEFHVIGLVYLEVRLKKKLFLLLVYCSQIESADFQVLKNYHYLHFKVSPVFFP